jgi:HEAT repeat protein
MTKREIALHLALLMLLVLVGSGFYSYQKSSAMVPFLIRHLDSDSLRERQAATFRLQELGNAARAAAPRLLELTSDSLSRDAADATTALSRIDLTAARAAMESAQTALRSPDAPVRRRAAETLGGLGLFARPAVPALVAATHDADALVRDRAVRALARIGVPAEQIIPALIAALDDPVYHVRHAAVAAFNFDLSPAASTEALPALQRLAQDPNPATKQLAQFAARRLNEAHPIAIELSVARYMLVRDRESQLYTLRKLAMLGPPAAPLVADLVPLLQHPEDIVRYTAVETLGAVGPSAREAASAVRALLEDREPVIRDAAGYALLLMGENRQ